MEKHKKTKNQNQPLHRRPAKRKTQNCLDERYKINRKRHVFKKRESYCTSVLVNERQRYFRDLRNKKGGPGRTKKGKEWERNWDSTPLTTGATEGEKAHI